MINPQLLEYVRVQRANGLSKEAIIQALAAGGWTPNDVNEAYMAIDGVKVPPPPPPPAAPIINPPRTIIPPVGSAPVTIAPADPVVRSGAIVSPAEISTTQVKKSGSWLLILLIIFFLVIIAGGVALAVLRPGLIANFIPDISGMFFPKPSPAEDMVNIAPAVVVPTPTTSFSTSSATSSSLGASASSTHPTSTRP